MLADDRGIAEGLVEILGSAGARVTIVRPGSEFAWTGSGETMLTPGRPEDYELLLDELQARGGVPEHFLHLWGVGGADDSIDRGLLSVLFLGQALGRRQNSLTSLMVVTSAVQEVLGDETLSPRAATVLGPCRVIPQEYPLVSCRTLDLPGLDSSPIPASHRRAFAVAILAEVSSCSVEPTVALRGRYRWLPSYEPVAPVPVETGSAEGPPGLRPRGVYLVTGGLGHVGLALAEYLARVAQARLVLTGREGLPDPDNWDEHLERSAAGDLVADRIRAVRKLQGLGAEVLVLGADVADFEAMRRVLEVTRERFGTLHGVIHAAGHLGPGTFRGLDRIDREDCERQLRPKLRGAQVLATLLDEELLDFVLLTSSVSTVLGGLGMGAYAAANHALDAFARRQHQAGKKAWISVGWDGWRFDTASTENRLSQVAILPKEGGEVFARLLALGPHPQVIVSTTALEGRLAEWTRQRTSARLPHGGRGRSPP